MVYLAMMAVKTARIKIVRQRTVRTTYASPEDRTLLPDLSGNAINTH